MDENGSSLRKAAPAIEALGTVGSKIFYDKDSFMSSQQNNPCLACNVNQQCCSHLAGLRLSQKEFDKYFKIHSDRLSITNRNNVFIVSAVDSGPCPHWEPDGCRIYNERPVDCRVYPYEIIEIREKKKVIEIVFRDSPTCPQINQLAMPFEEAEELMKNLGQAIYGYSKPIVIKYVDTEKIRTGIFRLFGQIIARLSRILR